RARHRASPPMFRPSLPYGPGRRGPEGPDGAAPGGRAGPGGGPRLGWGLGAAEEAGLDTPVTAPAPARFPGWAEFFGAACRWASSGASRARPRAQRLL